MKRVSYLLVFFLFFSIGCIKSKEKIEDEKVPQINDAVTMLTFGSYYGMCQGDCVNLFTLTPQELIKEATSKLSIHATTDGEYMVLSKEQHARVVSLLSSIPSQLLTGETDTTFGCPDCADQGGYYIAFRQKDTFKEFYLDTSMSSLPEALQPFAEKVGTSISELKKEL